MGDLGGKYAIVHRRGSYLEVDQDDMRSENRLLDVIERDGALRLHLLIAKSTTRYLADSKTLIPYTKWEMRFRTVIKQLGGIRTLELVPGILTNRPVTAKFLFMRWGIWGV